MATKKGIPVNMKRAISGLINSEGFAAGIAGDSLVAGSGSGAYVLEYVKSAQYARKQREIKEQTGGGITVAQVAVSDAPMQAFPLTTADVDPTFGALCTGGAVDSTNSLRPRHSNNSSVIDLPPMFLMIQQQYKLPKRGANGTTTNYKIDAFPFITMSPEEGGPAEREFATNQYQVIPSYTDKDIMGTVFSAASGMKPSDGILDFYSWESNYPLHAFTYKRSTVSAGETFTLPYLPISPGVTINATENDAWENGIRKALTSASITTGGVVIPAGAIGDMWFLLYATNFVPSV